MGRTAWDCTRRWQAEAVEDGRLDGLERMSFERHRATCAVCAEEQRALESLRELGQGLPEVRVTEFERRRLRHETLRRADAIATGGAPARRWWENPGAAALAAVIVFMLAFPWMLRSEKPVHDGTALPGVLASSRVGFPGPSESACGEATVRPSDITAERAAVSTPSSDPTRIAARSVGSASPSPRPKSAAARVSASSGVAGPARSTRVARSSVHSEPGSLPEVRENLDSDASGTPRPGGAETAGLAFAQAFEAFSRGAYAIAEEGFLQFEKKYRTDTRVEDAAFLRAICRRRRGDHVGAARGAGDYLRQYPDGFRRPEAESILISH